MHKIYCSCLIVVIVLVTGPFFSRESLADVSSTFQEANSKFTYHGKPIHPFLLMKWPDDSLPIVTTIDVSAAFDSYEYRQSTIKQREDWWFAEKLEKDGDITLYESFSYRWLGKLGNGVHVLETGYNGGGSGFFMDLMFVKFSEGVINWNGKKSKQLLMSIAGTYRLGDRYEGSIKVSPDKVFIPASKNQYGGGSIHKDIELKFPIK